MSTLLWILVIYMITIVGTMPFIIMYHEKIELETGYVSRRFMSIIMSFIPVYNIKIFLEALLYYRKIKKAQNVLHKLAKKYKDTDPNLGEELSRVANMMNEFNQLKE